MVTPREIQLKALGRDIEEIKTEIQKQVEHMEDIYRVTGMPRRISIAYKHYCKASVDLHEVLLSLDMTEGK